jgi:hypothetical protein
MRPSPSRVSASCMVFAESQNNYLRLDQDNIPEPELSTGVLSWLYVAGFDVRTV